MNKKQQLTKNIFWVTRIPILFYIYIWVFINVSSRHNSKMDHWEIVVLNIDNRVSFNLTNLNGETVPCARKGGKSHYYLVDLNSYLYSVLLDKEKVVLTPNLISSRTISYSSVFASIIGGSFLGFSFYPNIYGVVSGACLGLALSTNLFGYLMLIFNAGKRT